MLNIERQEGPFYTKKFEFYSEDEDNNWYPLKEGSVYFILYTKNKIQIFVDSLKKKSYLYKNNQTLFNQYKNANGSLIRELYLKPYTLVLTDIMRKKDSVIRYFAKSKLDKHDRIFEINKLDYNSEANFYDKVSLIWQLQGSKENILLNNTKILENAEKIFEGIEDFLDPLEFYEEEITLYEEIQEKLGRLKFPPELPTGGSGGASG